MNKYEEAINKIDKAIKAFDPKLSFNSELYRDIEDVKYHIKCLEFRERLIDAGFNLNDTQIPHIQQFQVVYGGPEYRKLIRWLSNCKMTNVHSATEPKVGEFYVEVYFSTGPYVFGIDQDEYHAACVYFDKMYDEFKSYNPDHFDDINNDMFFNINNPNAPYIYNEAHNIVKKYADMYHSDKVKEKSIKIQNLKAEIERLEKEI